MNKLILKAGREKSLKRRHPWVFSGAVARVEGQPQAGETVEVRGSDGVLLARAAYSPQSQIRARVWTWSDEEIDGAFFARRIGEAVRARVALDIQSASDSMRLMHGESDGLPGIVADRYGDTAIVQILSTGAERWREAVGDALVSLPGIERVWERSDADVRVLEGLEPRAGLMRGPDRHEAHIICEHGLKFRIDIEGGHKTGFYLDQRDNRLLLRSLARGRDVLDCFSYTGGFAVNALRGGAASVVAMDSSGPALELARANAALNNLGGLEALEADVFQALRRMRDQGRSFDVIVLDPPKFAPTAAHAEKASRAYKDINLLAFKMLRPGGTLMTFSCSGGVTGELFRKIVAGAALDAGVEARVERWLHAAADHPVALNFPEGEYLKGLVCRVAG